MRNALRLACASPIPTSEARRGASSTGTSWRLCRRSPIPISAPSRRASSTGTSSSRCFIDDSPLFDFDAGELDDLRVLRKLAADESSEVLGRAGLHFDADLRERLFGL